MAHDVNERSKFLERNIIEFPFKLCEEIMQAVTHIVDKLRVLAFDSSAKCINLAGEVWFAQQNIVSVLTAAVRCEVADDFTRLQKINGMDSE
jgi:hypothetical protein